MVWRTREPGTTSLGLQPSRPRDLIGDIQAQHRRKLLRRAAAMGAFALAVILAAVAVKTTADRRKLEAQVTSARERFALGTAADLSRAEQVLERALQEAPGHRRLEAALALVRAQRAAEYGVGVEAAREAVAAVAELDRYDAVLARGLLAVVDGDFELARASLLRLEALDSGDSVAPGHDFWLSGQLALAAPEQLGEAGAIDEIEATLAERVAAGDQPVAVQRLHIALLMSQGKGREALDALERARKQSATHEGLAADEALYNAVLRQKLGGVASVSEQLLEHADELSPPDRAHARLARAVVHLYAGEGEAALAGLDAAWPDLSAGDRVARSLALEVAMEAGHAERALTWVAESSLSETDVQIYEAWSKLVESDVMGCLERTAKLPQSHPRVAYIQGLALVEQGRWKEARPWLERADRLIPGRVTVEVALARVDAHIGDPRIARRKLEGLAKEEPYAPRAWTGLGEALLALARAVEIEAEAAALEGQGGDGASDGPDPAEAEAERRALTREAEQALERAVEVERTPAEARLLAAQIWQARGATREGAYQEALTRYEAAVELNPRLPRYREALGRYLAFLGHEARATAQLAPMVDEAGVSYRVPLLLVELALAESARSGTPLPAELDGWVEAAAGLGAPEPELERSRAAVELARAEPEDLAAALARMEARVAEAPDDIEAQVLVGRILLRQRESKQALTAVRRALASTPKERSGRLEAVRGYIELRKGKYPQAAMFARSGFELMLAEPRPPRELLEAGRVAVDAMLRARKAKPAVGVARNLSDRVPYHSDAWVLLAEAQLAAKKTSDALASAERAIELDGENATAYQLMGNAWLRFGKKDEARAAYEKALALVVGTGLESSYRENLRRL